MNWRKVYYRTVQLLTISALIAAVVCIYYFLSKQPPPPTSPENIAKLYYMAKDYNKVVEILRPLVKKHPENVEANYLLASALYLTQHRLEAEMIFERLHKEYPNNEDVQLGLADTWLSLKRYDQALAMYEHLAKQNPSNAKYRLILGEAYYTAGRNQRAAETFRYMIQNNMEKEVATKQYLALYGLPTYQPNIPLMPPFSKKPMHTQLNFRTNGNFIEYKKGEEWEPVYLNGLNLSAAAPGYYVSSPPREYEVYQKWLQKIADMNCNVVRVYTLAPPAFYQALKDHNAHAEKKLWLFQEVWLHVRNPFFQAVEEAFNLYNSEWEAEFMDEIINVIDAVHGHADVPKKQGRTGGIYLADVSEYMIGLGLGKEVETYIAVETNQKNPEKTTYEGEYIRMEKGTPFEAWFAKLCDFTVYYEMAHYNAQCPLTVINAPQFDPMHHPSEASFEEQHAWEKRYGLPEFPFQRIGFENDVVELNVTLFSGTPLFTAGLFACYHSYPHWPDFMWADWNYQIARDKEGVPSPFYGYIVDLKEHYKDFPLVMGEYGVSTSWFPVYNTINSINQGGYTEKEQADLLVKWSEYIFQNQYAGGVVFEFQDEWWHASVVLANFQEPVSRPLWFNVLDAESNYGVETYVAPQPTPLLMGKQEQWNEAKKLTSSSIFKSQRPGELKRVYATSDFAFLYIRLDVKPWEKQGWDGRVYWIALSTDPGQFGSHLLPEIGLNLEAGANFLIQLEENKQGVVLIAKNYNPHEWEEASPLLGGKTLVRKTTTLTGVDLHAPFEEILIPTQPYHIGRDGTIYPEMHTNMSWLRYGTVDYSSPDFNELAAWHYDRENGMIEIRIPWMLLFVIDPPNRGVLAELSPGGRDFASLSAQTPGIGIVAISIDSEGKFDSLPANDGGYISSKKMPKYSWEVWNQVPPYESRMKKSYFSLQKLFKKLDLQGA